MTAPEFRRIAKVAWLLGVAAMVPLSLLPQTAPPADTLVSGITVDMLLHVVAYGCLAAAPALAFAAPRAALLLALAMAPYGLGLEWLQDLVPGRQYSLSDAVANAIGAGAGTAAGWWLREPVFGRFRSPADE